MWSIQTKCYTTFLEGMYDTENLQLPVTTKKAH